MKKLLDKIVDYLNSMVEEARFASMVPAKSYAKINNVPQSKKA